MKTKNKLFLSFVLVVIALTLLASCSDKFKYGYDTEWIIGKKSSEIVERYGEFDAFSMPREDRFIDGEWRSASCGYITFKGTAGFLGTPPNEYYMIVFDSEGKACIVHTDWVLPGG